MGKRINGTALKDQIITAVKESCETKASTINKVLDAVREIRIDSNEPGVELVDGLSSIIKASIDQAVKHGCDIGVTIQGIIIGAFRSSDAVREEAHKTLEHLIRAILTNVVGSGANLEKAVEAIIKAVIVVAEEQKLNIDESLSEAGTSAVLCSLKMNSQVQDKVRSVLSGKFSGHKVVLKEEFLKKAQQ